MLSRWIRPCFSHGRSSTFSDRSRPGMPLEPTPGIAPPRVLRPCVQRALTQRLALHAGANSHPCEVRVPSSFLWARQALHPRQSTGRRRCHFGTLLGATGGTQTHSRRTGRKLGRLRYARQGLVRVPESNTKYGGREGKTGVSAAPVMGPSISESSGIPKRKNCPQGCGFRLRPLFTGRGIFSPPAIEFSGLT
jgi:hypothetical protein